MTKKVLLCVVAGILLFSQNIHAQTWSSPIRLTWNSGDSEEPVVAIGTDDSIHVIWNDYSPGNSEIFYKKSINGGTTWAAAKRLTWTSSYSIQPVIAVDSSNDIHVIWADSASGNYELYYKKSTDGGTSWPASKRLTWTAGSTSQPTIAIDSSDTIHIICLGSPPGTNDIFHKKSTDGGTTWTSLKRLTWTGDYSSLPAFAIAPDDSLHVVWRESVSSNREIYYKKSTNGGTNWAGSKRLTWNPSESNIPDITVDLNNKIHVVWIDDSPGSDEVFYKSSTSGGVNWSASKRLTWHSWSCSSPNIAVGPPNVIHLAWYNYVSSTNPEIFYKSSENGGTSWLATKRLTWNSSWSGRPVLAIDSGTNVHMVWEESIGGSGEVYYRNRK